MPGASPGPNLQFWQSCPSSPLTWFRPSRCTVGRDYRLEWIDPYAGPDAWLPLATVTLTNNPQYYFDLSATGQPARLYRSVEIPN